MNTPNIKVTYPRNDEYDYYVKMERIDLDKECLKDLSNQHGFIIKEPQPINKALKSEDSIFSSKFGRSLQDKDPYSNRYSCKYGCTQGAFYAVPDDANWVCPVCGTEVKLVGDDFTYFGWIRLKERYCVIHPMMWKSLVFLIGKDNLEAIIEPEVELDTNGMPMSSYDKRILKKKNARKYKRKASLDQTYAGIGMLEFRDRFEEVIAYFYKKRPAKKEVYEDIMENKDIVFTHSIPVYTTQLRIAKVENRRFTFESTNADFNILAKLAATVNKDGLSIYRNTKYQNRLLWDMQSKINHLTDEIINILSGKKGVMRSIISGRTAFSERSVIVPDATLKMDEITLPYFGLALLMEQVIINIVQKSYNITYAQAYKIWYYGTLQVDQRILDIIKEWMYSYVVDGGKLVELTSDTSDKYIGKKVKMRFAMMCESPKGICNKCAGNLFTRIGVKEVGIAAYEMFSVIKNISMKAFHDSTVNITDVEKDYGLDKIFGFE